MHIFYINADQFTNKCDLLMAQIAVSHPDIILVSEMFPKTATNNINLVLSTVPGYTLYANFSPDDQNSIYLPYMRSRNICFK